METNKSLTITEEIQPLLMSSRDMHAIRNVSQCMKEIKDLVLQDTNTAQACFYSLKRQDNVIEGLSVRFAEAVAYCWESLYVRAKIVSDDGKFVTAEAVAYDAVKHTAFYGEACRRVTTKDGRRYSDDMIMTTRNAACSIATRNAIFKVVPQLVLQTLVNNIKEVAFGGGFNSVETYQKWVDYFGNIKPTPVSEAMMLHYLGISDKSMFNKEHHKDLTGVYNAIAEGSTSVEECFIEPYRLLEQKERQNKEIDSLKAKLSSKK